MTKTLKLLLVFIGTIAVTTNSNAQTKTTATSPTTKKPAAKATFTKDPVTGVEYHFFKHDKTGKKPKPAMGDFASLVLIYETEGDSIIFDSHKKGGDSLGAVTVPVKKTFNGCLEQGIAMMAVGDSAEFKVNIDSLFIKTFHTRGVPPQMKSYKNIVFQVKLLKIQTEKEIMDAQIKAANEIKIKEQNSIAKYLTDSNLHVTPTADSLFILKQVATNNALVQDGDSVFVTYVGKLLNGTVFDQSADHAGVPGFVTVGGRPTLAMVYNSQSMPLIKGWVEAMGKMHMGDKITILCPSALAYGSRAMGPKIPAYSPLIFDMEMLKVVPKATNGGVKMEMQK
ncbi:MAG TPA: FKBP-type peptidyl-prolyl cis-trans isomerase [Bacteroidia bacterium]|nr:FKBP-type peptidyl-prolyl cis-trans isomerase [Bacteroidia bacterium]